MPANGVMIRDLELYISHFNASSFTFCIMFFQQPYFVHSRMFFFSSMSIMPLIKIEMMFGLKLNPRQLSVFHYSWWIILCCHPRGLLSVHSNRWNSTLTTTLTPICQDPLRPSQYIKHFR